MSDAPEARIPERCAPCRAGDPPLEESLARAYLAQLPSWSRREETLVRSFELADFRAALRWLNRMAMLAEELDHHPDLRLHDYRRVEVVCWTHAVGGLALPDFVLARRIDALAADEGLS